MKNYSKGNLIIARKAGQKIMIGNDVLVTICRINSSTVSVSIEAPKAVPILRAELRDREQTTASEG